jgi:hypothetical protein
MPQNPTTSTISIDGVTLTLILERKRVKNVNARLRGTSLNVSAPFGMAQCELDPIITTLARTLVRRERQGRVNEQEDALVLAEQVAARFPTPPPVTRVLFVTTQQKRWGSYSTRTGTIRLHAALREMPRWVLRAVMAHELAHVAHPDHAAAFWSLLREVCPETDRAEAFLAGVSWLGRRWEQLPPVERSLLTGTEAGIDDVRGDGNLRERDT